MPSHPRPRRPWPLERATAQLEVARATFSSPRSAVVRRTCSVVCRILAAMWR
ncbi:hypothetical protein ACGFSI_33245 [Streptomyces virginiae]|uniref:hypothetical protein n=1 Tax=Streptomyces virginiae TaxID=1961 RepID=UPI003716457D